MEAVLSYALINDVNQRYQSAREIKCDINASWQDLRGNDTRGKSVWKIEEKEGTAAHPVLPEWSHRKE